MAVTRKYTEDQLMRALMIFGGLYLSCPDQDMVDACERALDMLMTAAHEPEMRS